MAQQRGWEPLRPGEQLCGFAPGRLYLDLVEEVADVLGGIEILGAVPALIAVSPVEGPGASRLVVAGLRDLHSGPFGVGIRPEGPAFQDGDGAAADISLEPHLMADGRPTELR